MFKKSIALTLILVLISVQGFSVCAEGPGSLSSLSTVLYEPQSGRALFEKDAHTPRPIASTTKIMTALLAVERCPEDKIVTVSSEAVRVEGSALGLRGGDKISMIDLVTGLLLESGNDAANVIAYEISGGIPAFAKLMNSRAKEIGMNNTVFVTPSGLDKGEHSSTAWDMALLAAEALKNDIIAKICQKESAVIRFGNPPRDIKISNHNRLLKLYPYAIGMKTGYTKKSGRCLVSAAEKDGVCLIAVTLKAGDDWNDHIALYDYGFSVTKAVVLPVPELPLVEVSGGRASYVTPLVQKPPVRVLTKNEEQTLRIEVSLRRFVLAPVRAGELLGCVRYLTGSREILKLDIVADRGVSALPPHRLFKRIGRGFMLLLNDLIRI